MLKKIRILFRYLYYKNHKLDSRQAVEKYKDKKIKRHLNYVSKNINYYKNYADKPLKDFPIMEKQVYMDNFVDLNILNLTENEAIEFAKAAERTRDFSEKLKGISVGLSSGTSNRRGAFLVSDTESEIWASYVLSKFLDGSILSECKIAFFMRANSNLYQQVGSSKIQFEFFDIYLDLSSHIERLNKLKPNVLVGQPSVLKMLANEKLNGTLQINPEKIISVAEVLESDDKEYIKNIFNKKIIHEAYQCTEGCIAFTCEHGNLHINEDIVHIEKEYIDEKRFVPIVTDFTRKAQPIIRYRLNDILHDKTEECPCRSHFMMIEKIEGREDDVFVFDGHKVFPDFIRRCISICTDISDYRIVQQTDESVIIYCDADEKTKKLITEEFLKLATDRNFKSPMISFQAYIFDKKRKLKRVERIKL